MASDILIRITGDPSSFKAAMGEVSAIATKTGGIVEVTGGKFKNLGMQASSLGSTLSLSVTAPLIAMGAGFVKAAADMEALKAGLASVATKADPLEDQLKRLKEVAKLPGLGFAEAIQGSVRLQSAGFSAQLAERSLKAFGNAIATVGGGKAELDGVATALSQIASKGKISAEEINQLAERVPQIRQAMKAAFGTVDTEVLQKANISATEFVTKVVAELEKLKTVSGGTKNSLENLGDAVRESAVRIGDKLLPSVTAVIPKLEKLAISVADGVDAFLGMPEPMKNTALALGLVAIAAGPVLKGVSGVTATLGGIQKVAGVAGIALGSLFSVTVLAGIVQTMSAIDDLKAKTKDYYDYLEWLKSGGKERTIPGQDGVGMGGVRGSGSFAVPDLIGVKGNAADRFGINLRAISQELGVLGDKAPIVTQAVRKLGEEVAKASNAIQVTSVAGFNKEGIWSEEAYKHSLVYIESLERTKTAVGKVKDAMYDYSIAGTILGKQLATVHDPMVEMALATEMYRKELQLLADVTKNVQAIQRPSNFPDLPQAQAPFPNLPGNKSISMGVVLGGMNRQFADGFKETSRAMRQVSTITTDLSRSIASSGIGLLFNRAAQADVSSYKREISDLEAEQEKLLAAQQKGQIVSTQLTAVQGKLADAHKRMGEELHKASFGFRALEAGKSIVSSLAQSITRVLIEGALEDLSKKLLKVGGIFGKVFDGGTGMIKSAVPDAGGISGMLGKGGGGSAVGSVASAGITGIVGAVAGVVGAVSSIVGNFQMMGMNKSLDIIVKHTLQTANDLANLRADEWTREGHLFTKLDDMWRTNQGIFDLLGRGGGGGGVVINNNLAGAFVVGDGQIAALGDLLVRYIKARL